MADSNLNEPVTIQATRLDTSILPRNIFSQSYLLYVINQGADVGAIPIMLFNSMMGEDICHRAM